MNPENPKQPDFSRELADSINESDIEVKKEKEGMTIEEVKDRLDQVTVASYLKLKDVIDLAKDEKRIDEDKYGKLMSRLDDLSSIELGFKMSEYLSPERYKDYECLKILEGHSGYAYRVIESQDGKSIISGSQDGTVKIWNKFTGECLETIENEGNFVTSICESHDGKNIIYSLDDLDSKGVHSGTIKIWDKKTGKCLKEMKDMEGVDPSLFFLSNCGSCIESKDGSQIISSYNFELTDYRTTIGTIKIWDKNSGECVKTINASNKFVISVVETHDGKSIISGSIDKTIKLWDKQTGKCLKNFEGHTDRINSVLESRDGKRIISCSDDNTIKIWNIETGECELTLREHNRGVKSIVESCDDKSIISGSIDQTIRVWNKKTGKCLVDKEIIGKYNQATVYSLVESRNNKNLFLGLSDCTIQIWGKKEKDV